MLSQITLTTVLTLLLLTPPSSARLTNPFTKSLHKKHPLPVAEPEPIALSQPLQFSQIRADGAKHLAQRGEKGEMKKRKVKVAKRKSGLCVVQTPQGNVTSSMVMGTASATASVTASVPGGNAIATGGSSSTSAAASSSSSSSSSSSTTPTSTSTSTSATPTATSYNSAWSLSASWRGSTFFDNWDFWNYADPTHGTVTYVSAAEAWNEGLVSVNAKGNAVMTVDNTQVVSGGRRSVRLHGHRTYTGGLVVMDAVHMPVGCGTWPAWWSNGPNWPNGGEIDILEGVNNFGQNQISLHTGDGCTMPTSLNQLGTLTTGGYDSYNCASYATSNQGCGVRDQTNDGSYGTKFNAQGGGVYAMKWDKSGINVWFFPRSSIPADLVADQPVPAGWGTPVANFPSTSCSPYQFFYDHFAIFDTTFCGDWAGADNVWNYAGYAGQDQSCAASTGYSTCADYVLNNGNKFTEAYWEVSYVKFFNSTSEV